MRGKVSVMILTGSLNLQGAVLLLFKLLLLGCQIHGEIDVLLGTAESQFSKKMKGG